LDQESEEEKQEEILQVSLEDEK